MDAIAWVPLNKADLATTITEYPTLSQQKPMLNVQCDTIRPREQLHWIPSPLEAVAIHFDKNRHIF